MKLERDDGFLIYNVEFYVGNEEYDYEIDADTGRIMDVDYEIEDDFLSEDTEGVKSLKQRQKKSRWKWCRELPLKISI